MTAERWQKIERIFNAAFSLAPEGRFAYLKTACVADEALADEVQDLLDCAQTNPGGLEAALGKFAASMTTLAPGDRLGTYEIIRCIAAGGMGEVYEAHDTRLGRRVALKLLPDFVSGDSHAALRLRREARLASSLNHPNILTVHEFGEHAGRLFIATEYVEGITLRARLAAGPRPLREALDIAIQVASALDAAHRADVVHRDIKPENIMLRPDGYVRVLDFGLAKDTKARAVSDGSFRTTPGVVLGTYRYMSPEQVRGDEVDSRTDIWSLGVVLYEMLAGRRPFEGDTDNHVAVAILEREPAPLKLLNPAHSAAVNALLMRALQKDPDRRQQSAQELLTDLNTDLNKAGEPDPIPRRRPRRGVTWIAMGLTLSGVGVWSLWRMPRASIPVTPLPAHRMSVLTTNGRVGFTAVSPDGKYLAFTLNEPGRQSLRVKQLASGSERELVPPSLDRYRGITFSNDSDHIYFVAYQETNVARLLRVPVLGDTPRVIAENVDSPIAFSPDGKRFAFVRRTISQGASALIVRNNEISGQVAEHPIASRKAPAYFSNEGPSWSPDGRIIAVALDEGTATAGPRAYLAGIDPDTGKQTPLSPGLWWAGRVAWLDHPARLAAVGALTRARMPQLLQFQAGSVTPLTSDTANYWDVTFSTGTRSLVALRDEELTYVTVLDVNNGRARRVTPDPGRFTDVSWTADGMLLTHWAGDIWTFSVDGERRQRLTEDDALKRNAHACSPYIVFGTNRSGSENIWRMDRDGRNSRQLTFGTTIDRNPQCSPDGKTVVFESTKGGIFRLWSVSIDGGEPVQMTHAISQFASVSPGGKWIACEYNSGGSGWSTAVFPFLTGEPRWLISAIPRGAQVKWRGTRDELSYTRSDARSANIWTLGLGASVPRQVTHFDEDRILAYDWSPDGRQLACVRGTANNNVVKISIDVEGK